MSMRTHNMDPSLYSYLQQVSLREPAVLKDLKEETYKLPQAIMQISPEQGQFMRLLIRLIGAKNILEVGVFTGYSTLSMALALPDDGHITACDINKNWTSIAQSYWKKAGVEGKIELVLAPAAETMQNLVNSVKNDHFDMAFIDADKVNYDTYYEYALKLVRPGGLILIDNTLWEGKVLDPDSKDPDTLAIQKLNLKILHDHRVDISLLPVGDGLTLVRKKIF